MYNILHNTCLLLVLYFNIHAGSIWYVMTHQASVQVLLGFSPCDRPATPPQLPKQQSKQPIMTKKRLIYIYKPD